MTAWTSPPPPATVETEPMRVLRECVELMERKAHDYQNPNSEVKQAMYYPNGLLTLNDIIWAKWLRIKSLIEAQKNGETPKNESLEDSYKDMINYCSFAVGWIRGKIDGQEPNRDILNKPYSNAIGQSQTLPYKISNNVIGQSQTCTASATAIIGMVVPETSFSYDHLDEMQEESMNGNSEDGYGGC